MFTCAVLGLSSGTLDVVHNTTALAVGVVLGLSGLLLSGAGQLQGERRGARWRRAVSGRSASVKQTFCRANQGEEAAKQRALCARNRLQDGAQAERRRGATPQRRRGCWDSKPWRLTLAACALAASKVSPTFWPAAPTASLICSVMGLLPAMVSVWELWSGWEGVGRK